MDRNGLAIVIFSSPGCRWADRRKAQALQAASIVAFLVVMFGLGTDAWSAAPPRQIEPASKTSALAQRAKGKKLAERADAATLRRTQAEQAQKRARLAEKLVALKRAIAMSEASRGAAANALATSERSISDANRRLRELALQQRGAQDQLAGLERQREKKLREVSTQQTQLERIVYRQYVDGSADPLKLYFSGDNPNRIERDLVYLGYVSRATAGLLASLRANVSQLDDLTGQTRSRTAELAGIVEGEQTARTTLAREQDARRDAFARVSKKLESQRHEAGALEADEKRLARVVEDLQRVIDRHTAEESARRAGAETKARAGRSGSARSDAASRRQGADPHPAPRVDTGPDAGDAAGYDATGGDFARLKGRLRLPVRGTLVARYGSQRSDGGPSWKGVFIRADAGTEARAVAPGRVVFADWLRGFGNLLIVDHGEQYLSIYGNNELLLKHAGDLVHSGDALTVVGNSGGNPETGLYFELRYRGKPFDPLSWANLR